MTELKPLAVPKTGWIPVDSSNIDAIAFLPAEEAPEGTLYIRFKRNMSVFRYEKVPANTFDRMKEADSVGKFFHAHIRGRFPHEGVQ